MPKTSEAPNHVETIPRLALEDVALRPTFDAKFLNQHAGSIIADPKHAIVELVANAWDGGAHKVEVVWPADIGDRVSVEDDGTGMTRDEFTRRWTALNYNRLAEQGEAVHFPPGKRHGHRLAYGRNGIGRHAMFCFADDYEVETVKTGRRLRASVSRSHGASPFQIDIRDETSRKGHGTTVSTAATRNLVPVEEIADLIGSRFVSDPAFRIFVNGREVTLTHLEQDAGALDVPIPGFGSVRVRRYRTDEAGRTSRQSGVAWWVKRRLVGMPSWDTPEGALLDARTNAAKRFTYVAEVDGLAPYVKPDWSGFHANQDTLLVRRKVAEAIRDDLRDVLRDARRERKRDALVANRDALRYLPPLAQENVARFLEEIQVKSPTIPAKDLEHAATVLASLERSRSGYSLLSRLAKLSPEDLDGLDAILDEWSVKDAKEVLGELGYRLKLIAELEALVEKHTADELHDLQPLFDRGLWIFGPEFESISFTSNRSLAAVVEQLLGTGGTLTTPRKRPDYVVLPNASIGVYSADDFDQRHEVRGIASVIIVELKRGGSVVADDEKDQAMRYARQIMRSGKVSKTTEITCYVLGTELDPTIEAVQEEGLITVNARTYQAVLRQAHARTYNLQQKIKSSKVVQLDDPDLAEIVDPNQGDLEVLGS